MRNNFFKDKVAIITGSSQGIGKTLARELLEQGARVVINGRNEEKLFEAQREFQRFGQRVVARQGDVGRPSQAAELIQAAVDTFGRLDILVNNAGLSMKGALADLDPEVYKRVFDANVLGSVNTTVPALPHLRKSKGSVVFISSVAGIRGLPDHSAYSSSKMALRAIAESLRIEEASSGVHIGLMYVGFTENEADKKTFDAHGSLIDVDDRRGLRPQSQTTVARAILRNIRTRRFLSTLSFLGKLLRVMHSVAPKLVEYIFRKSHARQNRGSDQREVNL